jgi:hypothetical protein
VRRNSLDVLHDALNSSTSLVAIAVQSTLEEDGSTSEHSTLKPSHAVTEVIETDLLTTGALPHARDGNFTRALAAHGDLDHLLATSGSTTTTSLTTFRLLDLVIVCIILEEA